MAQIRRSRIELTSNVGGMAMSELHKHRQVNRRGFLCGATSGGLGTIISGLRTARGQSKTLAPIKLFIGSNPAWGNLMVGTEKGFFEKEGVPVEITYFASGATAVDAFRAGRGHLVGAGDLPSLRLWQQGGLGICPQANYGDLSVVVAKKSVTRPADLRGKKIGVLTGSTVEYFAKLYLASGGVDYKEVEVVNLRPMEMVTGFVRGDIDAFVIFQPFGWRAIQADPNAHIVTTAEPFFREWLVVNATPEYARAHKQELVAFLKGLDQAGKWITANMDEATQIVAKSLRMDDVATVKMMLHSVNWNIAYTRKFRSDMGKVAEFFQVPIDWAKNFDTEFLAQLGPGFVET
jgi:ABC-type nitrate/sulfonate/bicarbonate transport system substrate-binding protein